MREEPEVQGQERDFGEVLRHELNNPLTGILGNAELLLVELPPAAHHASRNHRRAGGAQNRTVRRLSAEWRGQVPHLDGNAGAGAETIADAVFTEARKDLRKTAERGA